ncbi:GTPase HflX [Gulosibacter chungangensis]|uniref:GTPase HflX n=1 Tax=Gulosibacter chungangensis TaxID=979746 RepID=A0A7J5B8V6_9MICO|nr:GTPase HflX [Gulosibacter chungangensis]KAB1641866.1 GTPase HflX [Gulosibacter chungangensis]
MLNDVNDSRDHARPESDDRNDAIVDRVLARGESERDSTTVFRQAPQPPSSFRQGRAEALQDDRHTSYDEQVDGLQLEREERRSLQFVESLSTELEDVTEVENRQVRLENVVLIGVYPAGSQQDGETSLQELAALCETAGARVLEGLLQRRPYPDPATYLGRGKAGELAEIVAETGADTVVADTELAPSQRRALEDVVKVKVIDRTAVILDIFSQHAKSREGKAQVELAQLSYLLPRLRGWGESMSRQAGGQVGSAGAGMGSRGPGETKIELDRRRIHTRMAKLRREIAGMKTARDTKRARRDRNLVPAVAIAGYTNAGKSSLLNRITRAGVLVENQLFATLDATVRRTETPDGRPYTLADTVGFVRNLPHQLVEAFRSTLEEVADADVLVHVVDAAHPDPAGQIQTVREVIGEIDSRHIPELIVFNKADLIDGDTEIALRGLEPNSVFVSARTGEGIEELLDRIAQMVPVAEVEVDLVVPYSRGDIVSFLHDEGGVLSESHEADGTHLHARVHPDQLGLVEPFRVGGAAAPERRRPNVRHKPNLEPETKVERKLELPRREQN